MRALKSIAAQSLPPREIIVVDDSGEGAGHTAACALEESGCRGFRLISHSHAKGVSGARNTGAEEATGEFLAFLDDDDEWLPSYLREAARLFESAELDVVCTDLLCRFNDGMDRVGKAAPESLAAERFLVVNPGLIGSNLIVRRSLFLAIGGFDETLPAAEDVDLGLRLSLRGAINYRPLPQRLVRHYQHSGTRLSATGSEAIRGGIRRFYELHGHRMTPAQREEFRRNTRFFWGIDENGGTVDVDRHAFAESLLPLVRMRLLEQRRRSEP